MDKVTIHQPQGLGDILFCQKIAYKLIEYGYTVYWPMTKYSWISEYINKDNLIWGSSQTQTLSLNLQNSIETNHPYDVMSCKYDMIGKTLPTIDIELHSINYCDWSDYLIINRNKQKEDYIYYNILGLKDNEEYVFINQLYGNNQFMKEVPYGIVNKNLKVINKKLIDGYTLFDWSKVIENASEIHTVDTSINYLIDVLNIKSKILKVHPRNGIDTKKCLFRLFKTKWDWVC